jgi:SAM-dependent methyltransferase
MSFFSGADAYDKFMGRYSARLASAFVEFAGVDGGRVVDVGAGTGTLTAELLRRGALVSSADPSEPFVEAARQRFPGVDAHVASAEALPFADGEFDAALAQLVVNFMSDPVAGVREMARVTKAGGIVAACVWDIDGDRAPLSPVWVAANKLGFGGERGNDNAAGTSSGQLRDVFEKAGLAGVEEGEVSIDIDHATFAEWWEPFTHGVGPVGAFVQGLDEEQRAALVDELRGSLGDPPSGISAVVWAAKGRVPS